MKTLVAVVAFNEGDRLRDLIKRFPERRAFDLVVVDDGSTDGSAVSLSSAGICVLAHRANRGVGAAIRTAIQYARSHRYDVIVIMAGNGKMDPREIPLLTGPIEDDRADYVQGSRYLDGGRSPHLPLFRDLSIRLFTLFADILLGFRGTDVTCGFRAYRLDLLDRLAIDLDQPWLDRYELEYYLHYKAVKSGCRVREVPVSMTYPETGRDYSKIRPVIGWWSMIRPWLLLVLGIKK